MNEKSLQEVIYEIENFLGENYSFRRNLLSGKTEVQEIGEGKEPSEWCILTEEVFNSILLKMMKEDVGGKSPKQHTLEIINSEATVAYDPIKEYLKHLPQWDGRNHVAELFNRIPGLTSEQLSWCCTWLRSAVAHWMGIDMLHGNEAVPVLIGAQGCGKTTFATLLLPVELRAYFLDHINFGNKFDTTGKTVIELPVAQDGGFTYNGGTPNIDHYKVHGIAGDWTSRMTPGETEINLFIPTVDKEVLQACGFQSVSTLDASDAAKAVVADTGDYSWTPTTGYTFAETQKAFSVGIAAINDEANQMFAIKKVKLMASILFDSADTAKPIGITLTGSNAASSAPDAMGIFACGPTA